MLSRALEPALRHGARILPMFTSGTAPAHAADLADAAYAPLHFDIALMGMGADGHTASWFPGAEGLKAALDPAGSRTVAALRAPQAAGAADRLSLTLAALQRAERVLLLITGDEKRARLGVAAAANLPVAALLTLPSRPEVLWAP
jgi:6-phosphogluconolactonase